MQKLHGIASDRIFNARNESLSQSGRGHVIDVHGLHAVEAVDRVHRRIAELTHSNTISGAGKSNHFLDIITGVGRHSWQGVSKVRPAILQYLEQGHRFEEMDVSGTFRVYL